MYNTPELVNVGNIGEVVLGGGDIGGDNVTNPPQLISEGAAVGLDE
jgi:hypothetical protein